MLHTIRNSKRLADLTINLLFSIILFRIRIIASILIPLNYFTVTGWAKFLNSKQTWLMWIRDLLFLTEEVLKVTLCFHSKIISYFQKIQEISIWQAKLKDCQSFLDNASQPAPFPLCTAELKEKQLVSFECPTIMWLHSWQVWNPARQDSAVNCTLNSSKAELEWVTVICCCRTQDVQRSVGAGGGGVGARGQSQLRTQDAAEGLDVWGSGHTGVCYHRVVAAHFTCGR